MTVSDAHHIARILALHGHTDSDALTTADMDVAADLAGACRPEGSDDRHAIRAVLDTIGEAQ